LLRRTASVEIKAHLPEGLLAVAADAAALRMIRATWGEPARHGRVEPARGITALSATGMSCSSTRTMVSARPDAAAWASSSTAGRIEAGVGLYLVSRLMERMHGYAVYCSSPGDGFRAELWLRTA
jgi:hypothetical protein